MGSEATSSLGKEGEQSHPAAAYGAAAERHGADVRRLTRSSHVLGSWRMVTFIVGALAGLLYDDVALPPALMLVVATVSFVAFIVLVVRHRRVRDALRRSEVAASLASLGLARIGRDWEEMGRLLGALGYADPWLDPAAARDADHAYLRDLDIFGSASIRALLGPTPTPTGAAAIGRWLSAPAEPNEVRRRQAASASLAPDFAARESLLVEALLVRPIDRSGWRAFLGWLAFPSVFSGGDGKTSGGGGDAAGTEMAADRAASQGGGTAPQLPGWLPMVARVLPVVTIALFAVYSADGPVAGWMWLLPLMIQVGLAWYTGQAVEEYFKALGHSAPGLRRHAALFAAWEAYEASGDEVAAVQKALVSTDGTRASDEIRALERWLDAVESRPSMLYPLAGVGLLADVHIAWGLERWRERAGKHVEGWFEALGELEALSALATLAHDHPDWCTPTLVDGDACFKAEGLGHPMLPESVLRTSDVELDPPGRFLLVTGSNMSGKSTLLRSIGLGAVMAQAGAVVRADRLVLTPLRTFSSMRIHDSITDGVSLFMAELMRLKELVDAADADKGEPALLYLIDEVLQGTNSEERRIAARRIVRHLLQANAIGAVTTHDLALHDDTTLDPASTKVHFRETVDASSERILTFDYQLRSGLATSRNALRLLKIVGLDTEE